jgi:hypothetical protein
MQFVSNALTKFDYENILHLRLALHEVKTQFEFLKY